MDQSQQHPFPYNPYLNCFPINRWFTDGFNPYPQLVLPAGLPSLPAQLYYSSIQSTCASAKIFRADSTELNTKYIMTSELSTVPATETPPLTPLETLQSPANNNTSQSDSITNSSNNEIPQSAPIRSSSRNRRPPAFIEGESSCPLCGSLLRASELAEHYEKELQSINNGQDKTLTSKKKTRDLRISMKYSDKKLKVQAESRKNVLARVRLNRQERLSRQLSSSKNENSAKSQANNSQAASTSHNSAPSDQLSAACPVCSKVMNCDADEMTAHVELCLSKQSADGSTRGSASSSDEEYDTYTWCGETRIRATSMLDNDELAASGFNKVKKCDGDEEDMNLVVDDDTDLCYGGSQYSEADIIPCTSDEPSEAKAQTALRQAVIRSATGVDNSKPLKNSKWTDGQTESSNEIFRCLICMDKYTRPVVSTQCWHVHCEECWLRTLGAKKLCPQCNLITSPADLRLIYL